MTNPTDHGPYETQAEARASAGVRAIHEAPGTGPGPILAAACAAAGIDTGAFDRRILNWLANFEPETCAVVAGLVIRAHAAGRAS